MDRDRTVVIFGEALTYPPVEGITKHVFSTLSGLAATSNIRPILVMCDRGYFDTEILKNFPWQTIIMNASQFYDPVVVADILQSYNVDIIQSYNVYQARLVGMPVSHKLGAHFVFEHHDVESELAKFLHTPPNMSADNVLYQKDILHYASLNRIMSNEDYKILTPAFLTSDAQRAVCLEVGFDDVDWQPVVPDEPDGVLFVGNCAYPPNATAADWIINSVAPNNLDIKFYFIGRNTEMYDEILPNVRGFGRLENVSEVLKKCFAGISPLSNGSGMKIKILSFSAAGLPVIGSKVSFHGYQKSQGFVSAESAQDYKNAFTILKQDDQWRRLGKYNRELYQNRYSNEYITNKLVDSYYKLDDEVLRTRRLPPTISRNDQRLNWIHETRDVPYSPAESMTYVRGTA